MQVIIPYRVKYKKDDKHIIESNNRYITRLYLVT